MEVLEFLHRRTVKKLFKAFGVAFVIIFVFLYCITSIGHNNKLMLEVIGPDDGSESYYSLVLVNGMVSFHSAKVTINGTPVVVAENGYFQGSADLVEGKNVIIVAAEVEGVGRANKTITVTYSQKK